MRIIKTCRHLVDMFLFWLFPIDCLGCGADGAWLCERCLSKINFSKADQQEIFLAKSEGWFLDRIFAVASFNNGFISELIKLYKYQFAEEAGKTLAEMLCLFDVSFFADLRADDIIIMPVPLHAKRQKWRGFNQSEILARVFAIKYSLKINDCLIRKINNKPQAKLTAEERRKNIENCFSLKAESDLSGKIVLLIDDVVTTGSTMNECARVLKVAGAKEVWGLAVAHG